MSDEPEVVANPPRILDRELNAAIITLANIYIPRGFEVRTPEDVTEEAVWQSCQEGRPVVYDRTMVNSIFGDTEVEHTFQALAQFFMFTEPVVHNSHRPHLCAVMMVGGIDRICEALVKQYGDDSRTQGWQKAILVHTIGRLAFHSSFGGIPGSNYDFVVDLTKSIDPDGTLPVAEVRDGFVSMYAKAERRRDQILGVVRKAVAQMDAKDTDATAQAQGVTYH